MYQTEVTTGLTRNQSTLSSVRDSRTRLNALQDSRIPTERTTGLPYTYWANYRTPVYLLNALQDSRIPTGRTTGLPYTHWAQYRTPVYPLGALQDSRIPTGRTTGLPYTHWAHYRTPVYPLGALQDSRIPTGRTTGLPYTHWAHYRTPVYPLGALLGGSGGVVNSLDFCPASLKSVGCFYFRCVLSSQWKAVTVNLRILHCQL